jgi:hypothetical protein
MRGLITVPDAIGARYRSPRRRGSPAVAILVAVIGYMATNILALGVVIDAIFGIGLTAGGSGWGWASRSATRWRAGSSPASTPTSSRAR